MKKLVLTSLLATILGVTMIGGLSLAKDNQEPVEVAEAESASSYSKIYRFTAPAEYWGETVYVHAWGSKTSNNNTTWPGINLSSEYSFNESDRKVYTFATNVSDYAYLIFHNNNGWQTDNITIGNNTAWYLDSGNTPGTWTPENQTYYLYDYTNMFGGNAKCYAWQSNGSLNNGDYPGVSMTKVQYGSGQLYSISLDPAFDEAIFGIGNTANTGDVWINHNRGQTYCWWKAGDGSWSNDMDWVKAHDWIYNTMHVRDIATDVTGDTGACKGANGYYNKAKTAYSNFSSAIRTKISQDERFVVATARFAAWARACGESATISGTTLSVANVKPIGIVDNNDKSLAIIISLISGTMILAGVGGYFFLRKKKTK